MSGVSGVGAAISRLFGSMFFLTSAFVLMAIWLLVLLLGLTGTNVGQIESPVFLKFPMDVQAFHLDNLVPADVNENLVYGVQCAVMILLVIAIWSYQYAKSSSFSGQMALSKLMVWTISCMFVVFYGFLLPTFLFVLNSSQLNDMRDGVIQLQDIQLYVLDQFFRSVVFDVLEALEVSISGLDYADDTDFGFKVLVTIYRLSVPMWVFMVWRRVRAPNNTQTSIRRALDP